MALGQPLEPSKSALMLANGPRPPRQLRTKRSGPIPWNLDIDHAKIAGDRLLGSTVTDIASGIANIVALGHPVVAFVAQVRRQFCIEGALDQRFGQLL